MILITSQKSLNTNYFLNKDKLKKTKMSDKRPLRDLLGKMVVTKEGKQIGTINDITFEVRSGELIQLVIRNPTSYTHNLNLERSPQGEVLVPHNTIMAIGDFVVVSEEDFS